MNGTQNEQHTLAPGRPESPVFSDIGGEDVQDDEHLGDYSTRLEELMSDDEDTANGSGHAGNDDEDDEAFFYSGVDSEPAGTYREQLRDVLGPEHDDDDASESPEAGHSLMQDVHEKEMFEASMDDEARVSPHTPLQHAAAYMHHTARGRVFRLIALRLVCVRVRVRVGVWPSSASKGRHLRRLRWPAQGHETLPPSHYLTTPFHHTSGLAYVFSHEHRHRRL